MKMSTRKEEIIPANPVELMAGWGDLFQGLLFVTWVFGVRAIWQSGDNIVANAFGIGLILAAAWFPGIIIYAIFPGLKNHLALMSSTYDSSTSVFAGGLRQAWKRCLCLPLDSVSGIGVLIALFLSYAVIIGNLGSVFNPSAWVLSLATGTLLSLGGTIIISVRLLRDFFRESRLKRQVF